MEEGGEEAVAAEFYAWEGAEVAVAEEVGGGFSGYDFVFGETGEGGFEGDGCDVGVGRERGEDVGYYVFVFFGLEGAGGVEEVAAGG